MFRCGERHPRAVTNWHDVELMRLLSDACIPVADIARKFDLPRRTVRNILNYNTWTSAPPPPSRRKAHG